MLMPIRLMWWQETTCSLITHNSELTYLESHCSNVLTTAMCIVYQAEYYCQQYIGYGGQTQARIYADTFHVWMFIECGFSTAVWTPPPTNGSRVPTLAELIHDALSPVHMRDSGKSISTCN